MWLLLFVSFHSMSSEYFHFTKHLEMLREHQYSKTYINTLTYIRGNQCHMLRSSLEKMHGFSVPNKLKVEFLPGEFHGQRTLAGYSPRCRKESDSTERQTLSLFRQMNAGGIYCTLHLFVFARVGKLDSYILSV